MREEVLERIRKRLDEIILRKEMAKRKLRKVKK